MDHKPELSYKHVLDATEDVIKWYELGVQLNFKKSRLEIIKANHPNDVEGAKLELVIEWLNNDPDKSWDKLASALRQIGHINLSDKISAYGRGVVPSLARHHTQSARESDKSSSSHPQLEVSLSDGAESASTKINTTLECIHEKSSDERSSIHSRNIRASYYELESQFGQLVYGLREDLKYNEENISKLRYLIQYQLPQRLKGIRTYISLESITMENFSNFFEELEYLWDFLDFDLLRSLIIFYKNEDLNNKLEIYEKNLIKFCAETTIQELVQHWMPRFDVNKIPDELKLCVTELSWDPSTTKVKDLKGIQKKLKDSLPRELAMAAFYICEVRGWDYSPVHRDILHSSYSDMKPIPPLKDYSMGTQDVRDFPMSTSSLTDWTEKKLNEKTLQAETELAKAIDNTEQEVKVGGILDCISLLAVKTVVYKGEEMTFKWDTGNLQIYFYPDGLPVHVTECTITIAIVDQKHFDYPSEAVPASFIYHIESSCGLTKAIKIKIKHFGTEKMMDNLMFAKCSSYAVTPCLFDTIEAGFFTGDHGDVHLESFSYLTVLYSRWFVKTYLISLYGTIEYVMLSQSCLCWKLYLSVIKNFSPTQSQMCRYFSEEFVASNIPRLTLYGAFVARFQEDASCIELDISDSEQEIQPGWFVDPISPQRLWKRDIDSYNGGRPPLCEIKLIRKLHPNLSYLKYPLTFKGVEGEKNFLKLSMPTYEQPVPPISLLQDNFLERCRSQIREVKRPKLKEEISERDIRKIAEKLGNWKGKIDLFGLNRNPTLENIEQKNRGDPSLQRIELIHLWKQHCVTPTYDALLQICAEGEFKDSAKEIVDILNIE